MISTAKIRSRMQMSLFFTSYAADNPATAAVRTLHGRFLRIVRNRTGEGPEHNTLLIQFIR